MGHDDQMLDWHGVYRGLLRRKKKPLLCRLGFHGDVFIDSGHTGSGQRICGRCFHWI